MEPPPPTEGNLGHRLGCDRVGPRDISWAGAAPAPTSPAVHQPKSWSPPGNLSSTQHLPHHHPPPPKPSRRLPCLEQPGTTQWGIICCCTDDEHGAVGLERCSHPTHAAELGPFPKAPRFPGHPRCRHRMSMAGCCQLAHGTHQAGSKKPPGVPVHLS